MAYHDALILRPSGLSKAEEMIIVATSAKNDCLYCVVAHGAILRIYAKDSKISEQIATDHTKADITDKQKAMLDFMIKTATNAAQICEAFSCSAKMALMTRIYGILAPSPPCLPVQPDGQHGGDASK